MIEHALDWAVIPPVPRMNDIVLPPARLCEQRNLTAWKIDASCEDENLQVAEYADVLQINDLIITAPAWLPKRVSSENKRLLKGHTT